MNELDEIEGFFAEHKRVECPLIHRFTPGLYVREVTLPADTFLTTKIHKTEHIFIISKGKVTIWNDGQPQSIESPFTGITKPGTRRLIYTHSDTIWTTVHANPDNCEDLKEIEMRLIEPHDNPLLSEEIKFENFLNQTLCHSLELQPE